MTTESPGQPPEAGPPEAGPPEAGPPEAGPPAVAGSAASTAPDPIPVTVSDPDRWTDVATQAAARTGLPLSVNLEFLEQFVATAVPAFFEADATGQFGRLRGVFADPVVAQCERNRGSLEGVRPTSVSVAVVGVPHDEPEPGLPIRLKLSIAVTGPVPTRSVEQFWDVITDQVATVAASLCPSCGAPVGPGELACEYCHASTAQSVQRPLLVWRLRLY
jgi:hypothetical protein